MLAFAAWCLLFAGCTFLSGWIAGRRGRSVTLWCWMGAIFGPIAPVAVAVLPRRL